MPINYKIAVIGDSVGWGQGLLEKNKYSELIAEQYGNPPDVDLYVFAHSGAKIGVGIANAPPLPSQEMPCTVPPILSQVDQALDPATFDLVLINGGINDIGFMTILDPETTSDELAKMIEQRCYEDMKVLLGKIISAFTKPTCRYILTGYFPILSSASNLDAAEPLDKLLDIHSLDIRMYLDREPVVKKIVANALQFWRESDAGLDCAALETAEEMNIGKRLQFVACPFTEQNALFANNPWLWGFTDNLMPEDEVADTRIGACKLYYKDPLEIGVRELCYHASVGHPNVTGSAKIADAIWSALSQ